MTTRAKQKTVVPPLNLKDAERVMNSYASADAKLEQINSAMDEKITAIRNKYADELQELQESKKNNFQRMQMYAESNPELFKKKKSFETAHGLIGFRTGTPKLKTLRGYTWKAVLELLKAKNATDFIRTKEEPAKDLLLAKRELDTCKTLMAGVGLEVIQDDTFYIDLKKEETDN
jgi:phage host-nuclease inhibitor protein Gam